MKRYTINPPKGEFTQKDIDFQKFLEILKQYLGKYPDEDFFNATMSLTCKDYRLHYLKSQ